MSRHRNLLRAVVRLGGKSPEQIAAEVPMSLRCVRANLESDWPIDRRYVEPLEAWARQLLTEAHGIAVGALMRNEQLRRDPQAQQYMTELRRAYRDAFGVSIGRETESRSAP